MIIEKHSTPFNHQQNQKSLKKNNIEIPYTNVIKEIYKEWNSNCPFEQRRTKMKLGRDVGQVDTISLKIFSLKNISMVLHLENKRIKINGVV